MLPDPLHAPSFPSFHNLLWHPPLLWLATSLDQRGMHVQTGWPAHASVMFSLWESYNYFAAPGDLSLGTPMSSNQLLNFTNLVEIHYLHNLYPSASNGRKQLPAQSSRVTAKISFSEVVRQYTGLIPNGSLCLPFCTGKGILMGGQWERQHRQTLKPPWAFLLLTEQLPQERQGGLQSWPGTAGIYSHQETLRGCKSASVQ